MPKYKYTHENTGGNVLSWRVPVEETPAPEEAPRTFAQKILVDFPAMIRSATTAYQAGDIETGNRYRDEIRNFSRTYEADLMEFSNFQGENTIGSMVAQASANMLIGAHENAWGLLTDPRTNPNAIQYKATQYGWGPRTTEMETRATQDRDPYAIAILAASRGLSGPQARSGGAPEQPQGVSGGDQTEPFLGYATTLKDRLEVELPPEVREGMTPSDWAEMALSGYNHGDADASMAFASLAIEDIKANQGASPRDAVNQFRSAMTTIGEAVQAATLAAGLEGDDPAFRARMGDVVEEAHRFMPEVSLVNQRSLLRETMHAVGATVAAGQSYGVSYDDDALKRVARIQMSNSNPNALTDRRDREVLENTQKLAQVSEGIKATPLDMDPAEAQGVTTGVRKVTTEKGGEEVQYSKGGRALEEALKGVMMAATARVLAGDPLEEAVLANVGMVQSTLIANGGGEINPQDALDLATVVVLAAVDGRKIDPNNLEDSLRQDEGIVEAAGEAPGTPSDIPPGPSGVSEVPPQGSSAVLAAKYRAANSGSVLDAAIVEDALRDPGTRDFSLGVGAVNRIKSAFRAKGGAAVSAITEPRVEPEAGSEVFKILLEYPADVLLGVQKYFTNGAPPEEVTPSAVEELRAVFKQQARAALNGKLAAAALADEGFMTQVADDIIQGLVDGMLHKGLHGRALRTKRNQFAAGVYLDAPFRSVLGTDLEDFVEQMRSGTRESPVQSPMEGHPPGYGLYFRTERVRDRMVDRMTKDFLREALPAKERFTSGEAAISFKKYITDNLYGPVSTPAGTTTPSGAPNRGSAVQGDAPTPPVPSVFSRRAASGIDARGVMNTANVFSKHAKTVPESESLTRFKYTTLPEWGKGEGLSPFEVDKVRTEAEAMIKKEGRPVNVTNFRAAADYLLAGARREKAKTAAEAAALRAELTTRAREDAKSGGGF